MRNVLIGLALLATPTLCLAEQGTASGSFAATESHGIEFHYAAALRKDDPEHALDDEAGIWVLLSDKPVDPMAMSGGIFPQVLDQARAGAFEGVLFVVNAATRGELHARVLSRSRHPESQFESLTLSGDGLWKSLSQAPQAISGALDRDDLHFTFATPITEDPVKQDIEGAAALATLPAAAVIRNANAWLAGDLAGIEASTSRRRWAELAAMPAAARSQVVAEAHGNADLAKAGQVSRVTIRARTATVKTAAGFQDLVLEAGAWKVD